MAAIAIVTPCLNAVTTLSRCLDSVRRQSVPVEHIVADGGSVDGSLDLLRTAAPPGRGSLTLLSGPDQGMYDAMNKGIRRASADVLGILNADDACAAPDVLEAVLQVFGDPSVDAVFGDLEFVSPPPWGRVVRVWRNAPYDVRRFWNGWMPPHPSFFLRRRHYEQHGLYRTDFGTAADYELMLRMLVVHRLRAVHLPRVLVRMQAGGASGRTLRARLRAHRMDHRAWQVNGLTPRPWTLLLKPVRKIPQWFLRPPSARET